MSAQSTTQTTLFRSNRLFIIISISLVAIISLINPIVTNSSNPGDDLLQISTDTDDEFSPAVAFNPLRQEFLVVWFRNNSGCEDIVARRISSNGTFLGDPFEISTGCPDNRVTPDVAYNSAQDQYLIVWKNENVSEGWSILARRISGTGQLLDNTDIQIYDNPSPSISSRDPAVAYASMSDRYLVVWQNTEAPSLDTAILGQVVTGEGMLEGSDFTITDGPDSDQPDLAYNYQTDRYLVMWQMTQFGSRGIFGQQVLGSGGLYQDEIEIASYYPQDSRYPSLAALPTSPGNEKFMVVWELGNINDRDIHAILLDEDGIPGLDFSITNSDNLDEYGPAVVGLESTRQYFVTWTDAHDMENIHIRGQAFSYGGVLHGQEVEFPGTATQFPAGAAGTGGNLLAAWQDQPNNSTNSDIYGRIFAVRNLVQIPILLKN